MGGGEVRSVGRVPNGESRFRGPAAMARAYDMLSLCDPKLYLCVLELCNGCNGYLLARLLGMQHATRAVSDRFFA